MPPPERREPIGKPERNKEEVGSIGKGRSCQRWQFGRLCGAFSHAEQIPYFIFIYHLPTLLSLDTLLKVTKKIKDISP